MNRMRHLRHSGIGMTSQRTRDRMVQRLRETGIHDRRVLEAMRRVPRHLFLDEALASRAYEDTALPIGFGQTLSRPYTVARMTQEIMVSDPVRVLEVGTGSGYQAAVLGLLVEEVYTVERIQPLSLQARRRFREMHLFNVKARHTDGQWGWPSKAPFDAILVACAAPEIPMPLLEQLADGGRMVIPVGEGDRQVLTVVTRHGEVCEREVIEPASFVPLVDGEA